MNDIDGARLKKGGCMQIKRRTFLKGALAGSALLSLPLIFDSKADAREELKPYKPDKVTFNFCEMCFWNCTEKAFVNDGKVRKLEGNDKSPLNFGKLCAKGQAGIKTLYDDNRLKTPLIRVGERGEGKWKKVSWEEAFEFAAKKFKEVIDKYGPETIALEMHGTGEPGIHRLFEVLGGTTNFAIPAYSQCTGSRDVGFYYTFGAALGGHEPYDLSNSRYIILLGRNETESLHVSELYHFSKAIGNKAKIVYVDPRYTHTAAKADRYLQIKSGTDAAFVLALINVMVTEDLINHDFVDKYTTGYDKLKPHIAKYTPQWAQEQTGIKADEIIQIAREISSFAPNCIIVPPRRSTRYGEDTQFARAIAIANALLGNWFQPGGFFKPNRIKVPQADMPDVEESKYAQLAQQRNAANAVLALTNLPTTTQEIVGVLGLDNVLWEAIRTQKPYPIKAMISYATNPLFHNGDSNKIKEAISKLDFYMVVDILPWEHTLYADIVFPESTYLEMYAALKSIGWKYPYVSFREPAVDPVYDTRDIWAIVHGIAKHMGLGEFFPFKDAKGVLYSSLNQMPKDQRDKLLKDGVISLGPIPEDVDLSGNIDPKVAYQKMLDAYKKAPFNPYPIALGEDVSFNTGSGKIDIYSDSLAGNNFDPLPNYTPPNKPKKQNEFRLVFGRVAVHTHARTQDNEWLLEHYDDNNVWINPQDAKSINIKDGDKVVLVKGNLKSPYPVKAKVTDKIIQGTIFIAHGWGRFSPYTTRCYKKGVSDAEFCSNDADPLSGAAAFLNSFVSIEKA